MCPLGKGGHFPVLIKFPDFSRCLRHTGDRTQIGLGVLVSEHESMGEHTVHLSTPTSLTQHNTDEQSITRLNRQPVQMTKL